MEKPADLARSLQDKLNTLHDSVVSEDPFVWTNDAKEQKRREDVFRGISDQLTAYRHVPKTGKVLKILGFGTALPLAIFGVLYILGVPVDENARLWVWSGLIVVAVASAIAAAVIASNPSLDEDLALAYCTTPRGWSFSRINTERVWLAYKIPFRYFDQGDEDQEIRRRLWGYFDQERKRAFQLFHFYFETVYYTTVAVRNAKGHITGYRRVKHEVPHHRYGVFAKMPESRIRFRITETGGNPGFNKEMKLEYGALNKAVNVYCDAADELAARQFLSPAVQETVMAFSDWLPSLMLDFYPGFVMLVTAHDPFGELGGISFDENTPRFQETLKPGIDHLVGIVSGIDEKLRQVAKYNDNY